MKSYTDLEQSKKLAEILPIESADMYYCYDMDIHTKKWDYDIVPTIIDASNQIYIGDIPCWSLAALFDLIPSKIYDDDGNYAYLWVNKDIDEQQNKDNHYLEYHDPYDDFEHIETSKYNNFVDACYEMILKLHEWFEKQDKKKPSWSLTSYAKKLNLLPEKIKTRFASKNSTN